MRRLRPLTSISSVVLIAGCAAPAQKTPDAPGIAFPTSLGEGSYQPENEIRPRRPASSDSSAAASEPPAPATSSSAPATSLTEPAPSKMAPPDPEPLRQAEQWEYEIASNDGELSVVSVKPVNLPKPAVTARRMGRYAIELWIGRELVERVRFDLPLLGAEEPQASPKPRFPAPSLEKGARVHARVLVPRAVRARRAVLIDRQLDRAFPLPWPPDRPASAE
jgi:hypothetical protein